MIIEMRQEDICKNCKNATPYILGYVHCEKNNDYIPITLNMWCEEFQRRG